MSDDQVLKLALPKGRMADEVKTLLADAGISLQKSSRGYRPEISIPGVSVKLLKPQSIVEMLHVGRRDVGFAGADWVAELGADLVDVLDTGLNPVRVVAAAPEALLNTDASKGGDAGVGDLPKRSMVVATEYAGLTKRWIEMQGLDATVVRTFGATEVFPPEDADFVVDNTATGATLRANGLSIIDTVMRSSTHLYAHPAAMQDPKKKLMIDNLVALLKGVLAARGRVMLEVNVQPSALEAVIAVLPSMRQPTVSPLHGAAGYAVKAAVPHNALPELVPTIRRAGGTDVVVYRLSHLIP